MSDLGKKDAYFAWLWELKKRYRATQIKAAVSVNAALLEFYWELGRVISERYPGKKRNARFFSQLSADLKIALPEAKGFSLNNLRYIRDFYGLYAGPKRLDSRKATVAYLQQVAGDNLDASRYLQQVADDKDDVSVQRLVANLLG